ncbi:MAG: type II toxin-antitoxin system HicA family toxin [Chloroflexota bacterium]|nr:type II toxin-antitoxin system HicA family toxin [Chloroflexota bacterium]
MPKVREAIRVVERDGWYHVRTSGSHRQFNHLVKPGVVTIAGHLGSDLPTGTWRRILKQAGLEGRER